MTTEEREEFREEATVVASAARARGEDPDAALAARFDAAEVTFMLVPLLLFGLLFSGQTDS